MHLSTKLQTPGTDVLKCTSQMKSHLKQSFLQLNWSAKTHQLSPWELVNPGVFSECRSKSARLRYFKSWIRVQPSVWPWSSALLQKCHLHTHSLFKRDKRVLRRVEEERKRALALERFLPVSQFCPLKPCGHTQMFGDTHEPPFRQRPSQRAKGQREGTQRSGPWNVTSAGEMPDGFGLTSAGGPVARVSGFARAAVTADRVETQSVLVAIVLPGRALVVLWREKT